MGKSRASNPLQEKLRRVCCVIGRIGINMSILIMMVMICKLIVIEYERILSMDLLIKILICVQMIVSLSILVVPEGIYDALNTYMAWSIQKLKENDIIVKDIAAFQYMG